MGATDEQAVPLWLSGFVALVDEVADFAQGVVVEFDAGNTGAVLGTELGGELVEHVAGEIGAFEHGEQGPAIGSVEVLPRDAA